jgi:hypothetical protein
MIAEVANPKKIVGIGIESGDIRASRWGQLLRDTEQVTAPQHRPGKPAHGVGRRIGVSASGQSRSPRADPRNGLRLIRTSLVLDATVADSSVALAIDLPVVRTPPKGHSSHPISRFRSRQGFISCI